MQKTNLLLTLKALVLIAALLSRGITQAQPAGATWIPTFEDQFDGTSLNTGKWSYGFGWGTASGAFQETTRPANVTISNGILRIKMECDNGYKSGAINSRNKFVQKYGYWEARIKVPQGAAGLLPAFWAKWNNDQWPPELDFMEIFGSNPAPQFTAHWGTSANHQMSGGSWNGGDLSTAFHTFGCEWDPDYVKWYVDGTVRRTFARPQADAFLNQFNSDPEGIYMMLNIHAANFAWTGGTLSCSNLPRYMEVDYVRVFKKGTSTPPSGTNLIKNGEFDNGTTDWSLFKNTGTTASLAAVTGEGLSGTNSGRVYIDNGGTADWHVSVGQLLPISSGKTYRISFRAKTGAAKTIRVGIQQNGGSNTLYWDQSVNLTTTATTYAYNFTAANTDAITNLRFFVGGDATDVHLDAITVTDGSTARTGYEEPGRAEAVTVFPNPAQEELGIAYRSPVRQAVQLTLRNVHSKSVGTQAAQVQAGPNRLEMNVQTLPNGVYLLELRPASGGRIVRKVIIAR